MQDISYDNKNIINKKIENGLLNQTQNNNINNELLITKKKKINNQPIYKKKIKITQAKSKIFKNKQMPKNNNIYNLKEENNSCNEKKINPNLKENENNKIEKIKEQKIDLANYKNEKNNIKEENNLNLNNEKKENNKMDDGINNNLEPKEEDINKENIEKNIYKIENIKKEENINELNNDKNENKKINKQNNNNKRIDHNGMSNGNNILNEDTDESDENITREIIVKDVSTRDKRLNVFIKYIEIPKIDEITNKYYHYHLLNLFQTDSIYLPASYPKKYNYYSNYYYGNLNDKNNKLKLHKILSSIIEEEEKSKAAGSVNNSIISEEENCNGNYSHFFIQSLKYVTNFLQCIFDDKKKDIFFQFFKILKRIKNESFLKGLINQKKYQTLNKLKDENEEENENNTSGDVILYNVNDNFNADIDYFGSKSNDRRDISNLRNKKKNKHKDNKDKDKENKNKKEIIIKKIKDAINENNDNIIKDKKYSSAYNFYSKNKENFDLSIKNLNLSMDISHKEKEKEKEKLLDSHTNSTGKKKIYKMKKKIEDIKTDEYNDKKDDNEIKENNDLNIDYENNVTISEACRGLSDVILDFRVYLVKYFLKKKENKYKNN